MTNWFAFRLWPAGSERIASCGTGSSDVSLPRWFAFPASNCIQLKIKKSSQNIRRHFDFTVKCWLSMRKSNLTPDRWKREESSTRGAKHNPKFNWHQMRWRIAFAAGESVHLILWKGTASSLGASETSEWFDDSPKADPRTSETCHCWLPFLHKRPFT